MTALATRIRTFIALGPVNAARALTYRAGLRLGIHPVQRIAATLPTKGPFFTPPLHTTALSLPGHWRNEALLFGTYRVPISEAAPAWTSDPLAAAAPVVSDAKLAPWWKIADFASGDIKCIWEYSRFDWALAFAQQARTGEAGALDRLNDWIGDWALRNPAYRGPNWKCAQEASIRVMHLSISALLLGVEGQITAPMRELIEAHVRRILPTLSYARAQDNNHATSEAAAIFIVGAWLSVAKVPGAGRLERRGRALIERTTRRLFASDGSFSQYSVNYHRVALDTLSIVELWRRRAGLPAFSDEWRTLARAAADWLRVMTDPDSGDAPNLGANDGANLLPLTDAAYRDFRPTVQLAAVLFTGKRAYVPGSWDRQLEWLHVDIPDQTLSLPDRAILDDGGYAVMRRGAAMAMLRYPRFRFRPSQADALHLDLWLHGANLLRDGGSFSYNTEPEWIDYFGGSASHNTITFDGRPQMPRLSRFLLGDWLDSQEHHETPDGFCAGYRHREGWKQVREVRLGDDRLVVMDTISGFAHEARLRWRLAPGDWRIIDNLITDGRHHLTVNADMPLLSIELVVGWESRHYLERTPLPVLEVVFGQPGRIITDYRWMP